LTKPEELNDEEKLFYMLQDGTTNKQWEGRDCDEESD